MTPFSNLSRSSSPPGDFDLDLKEVRYLEYLFVDIFLYNPNSNVATSSLPASSKKL